MFFTAVLICVYAMQVQAFQRFTNYGSVIEVHDIAFHNGRVCVATSGGLYLHAPRVGDSELLLDVNRFPDIKMAALATDASGTLWAGSQRGYLYKISPRNAHTMYSAYYAAGWGIRTLYAFGQYLLVGSTAGFSIFDAAKGDVVANTVRLGSLQSSVVNAIIVHNNVLYVGTESGIATLDIPGGRISDVNFYDHRIWSSRTHAVPVTGFCIVNNAVMPVSVPTVVTGAGLLQADSNLVYIDSTVACSLPSVVNCLRMHNDTCWIGTDEDYFYDWSAAGGLTQHKIRGLAFKSVNHVTADGRGNVWVFSDLSPDKTPWWQGIGRSDGSGNWKIYNSLFTPSLGFLGGSPDFRGACVRKNGDFWVGTPGGGVKCFSRSDGTWRRYAIGAPSASGSYPACFPGFELRTTLAGEPWSKCDAIAEDSSGFLWIASYENCSGNLICYDPKYKAPVDTNYYRFFPKSPVQSPYYMDNIRVINVDRDNTIFVGSQDGKILLLRHQGRPYAGEVTVVTYFNTLNLKAIHDMVSLPIGFTWIVTGNGLYKYNPADNSLTADDKVPLNLTSIEKEGDDYLWLGTSGGGIIRYDWHGGTWTRLDENDGLMSNMVLDLSLDARAGYLWAATGEGLSRYDLAHTTKVITENKTMEVYPNPFSFSDPAHAEILIRKVAPQTQVHIYDARGVLVKSLQPAVQNMYEWTFSWTPSRNLIPGTYFCTARTNSTSAVAKILIVP